MVNIQKQRGVVLITAMLMIVAVTAIAVTLMSSSTVDIKITNAAQERAQAESQLLGELQQVIQAQINSGNQSAFMLKRAEIAGVWQNIPTSDGATHRLRNLNLGELELKCPPEYAVTHGVVCNITEVQSTITYGRQNQHTVTYVVGIGQEVINISEGK